MGAAAGRLEKLGRGDRIMVRGWADVIVFGWVWGFGGLGI